MSPPIETPLITIVLGADDAARERATADAASALSGAVVVAAPPPVSWPFRYPLAELPEGPVVVLAEGLEDAAVNHQTANTRLVTTQARYLVTEWQAALERHGRARMVVTADPELLAAHAAEVTNRREHDQWLLRPGMSASMTIDVSQGPIQLTRRPTTQK